MPHTTRWTAGILSLVMIALAFAPIALAQSMQGSGMHCMRPNLRRKDIAPVKAPCHGSMADGSMANGAMAEDAMAEDSPSGVSSNETDEPAWRSTSECCGNHDCCCRMASSERDRILPVSLSTHAFASDRTSASPNLPLELRIVVERDSARAPPV